MAVKRHSRQITLGFLGTRLGTFMQSQLWRGAIKAAQEHQARLIFYPTISQISSSFTPSAKVLFDLVDTRYVDGLLVWYAGVAEGIGMDSSERFFDRYDTLPIVTIGGRLKNRPDLSLDNYQGVRAITDHLIEVHDRRHIGIIRGPMGHPDAEARYRGYVDALQAHGLPLDPDYVGQSLFATRAGAVKTQAVVTEWLSRSPQVLDAIVASSDNMASAAIKTLETHRLRVPDDIAIVGFDDIDISLTSTPAITTVRQPHFDMGYQATEMLLASIDGQSLPSQTIIPAQLVIRESCGCTSRSILLADTAGEGKPGAPPRVIDTSREDLAGELASIAQGLDIPISKAENLAHLFQNDLRSEASHSFLDAFRQYLIEAMASHFDVTMWQDMLSVLRRYMLSTTDGEMGIRGETLFGQARVLATEVAHRAHIEQRLKARRHIDDLLRTSEALITSFGSQLLMETIHRQLPELGFSSFYLSLYDDPEQPAAYSHLILACNNNQRLDLPPDGLRFPTSQLIPTSLPVVQNAAPIVVEPLYFREQQMGILVLEAGPTEGEIYENLRAQISGALQGSQLLQQTQSYAAQLEKRVAERTEELTRAVNQLQAEIAERQQAQEALAQERNLLRTLIDSMPDLIFAKDTESRFTLKNEADVRAMGASSVSEVIGKTDFDYYPHELAERFQADDQQVMQSGQPLINREEPGVDTEGNEHWRLTTKVPLRNSQGQVIGLIGMGRDITELKQAMADLAKTQALWESAIEQSPIPMMVVAPDGTITIFNQACLEMLGIANEPDIQSGINFFTMHRSWRDLDAEGRPVPLHESPLALALQGQATRGKEMKIHREDGSERWEVVDGVPIYDKKGSLIAGLLIFPDITDRKRVESLLRAQRDLALALGVASSMEGGLHLCLEAALSLSGMDGGGIYLIDEVTGALDMVVHQGLPPEFIANSPCLQVNSADAQIVTTGKPGYIENRQPDVPLDDPAQQEHLRAVAVIPIHHENRLLGCLSVASHTLAEVPKFARDALETISIQMGDVIVHMRAEAELQSYRDHLEELVEQRTAELKSANEQLLVLTRLKDEFVSNVSHELRTPISSIKLRQHLARSHPDQYNEHLDAIKRETDRLARTIEDMLQLSRLDQKRAGFSPVPIDLNELVSQHVTDRAPIASGKNLTLSFQEEKGLPQVIADVSLLGQVLGILLTNAVNYTPPGGQVLVKTHLRQDAQEQLLGFSVSDSGPGIPPEEQQQLFGRFFRGTTGRQSGVPGTGLGLAIAEEIVKRHAGRIEVESDGVTGHGATFRVWIPIGGQVNGQSTDS